MPSPTGRLALYLGLRSFLGIGGRLPKRLNRAFGPVLSAAALRLLPRTRNRICAHIEIAFPELDQTQRDKIVRGCSRHFGLMLAEVAWLWHARSEDVEDLCQIEGQQHVMDALADGRGAMFATAHCGNWELLSARLPIAGVPLISAVRQLDNRRLDRVITSMRTRFGTEIVPRGPSAGRRLARALTRNSVNALLIDQDIKNIPGVFVPFFGRPAFTPSGAATLALRMRSPMLPGFIHRRPDGTHVAEIHPPLPVPTDGTLEDKVEELTAAATAVIERQIRAHPEQWVWMHRRWRTRPESQAADH
jgi:KDO2-lipid IV(A) lauroyltransferase